MSRLFYHHDCLLARSNSCHMRRLLNRAMSADRWQGSPDGGLQFSEEVKSSRGLVSGIFVKRMIMIGLVELKTG